MSKSSLLLSFFGGVGTVTGANFGLSDQSPGGKKILVDCGLLQSGQVNPRENYDPFPYNPADFDVLFITHAHLDHIGRVPKLIKEGFKGKIFSTAPTKKMAELSLIDSLGVMTKEARHSKRELLYREEDVAAALKLWEIVDYYQPMPLGRFSFEFKNAGHIMGSAMLSCEIEGRKVVFTGDLGNEPSVLLPPPDEVTDADWLIIESVYGDRTHEGKDTRKAHLKRVIKETMASGGTLMIPAFSIERTQEMLFAIEQLMDSSEIPLVPVYLDSPLAIGMTDIYDQFSSYLKSKVKHTMGGETNMFDFPQLIRTRTTEESKEILNAPARKIIIAGSGMSNGGRILHHEKNYLPDPKSTLLLVGYQSPGSLGRLLADGNKKVKIMGEEVSVRAKLEIISGYSAHMDSPGLLDFVANSAETLKQVFVAMGEPKSSLFLAQRIRDYLGIKAIVPRPGDEVVLELEQEG